MLRNPYYTGVLTYKGEYFAGRHEPIVDQDLFDRTQEVMDIRSRRGQRDRVHLHYLKGMLFCERCHQAGRTCRLIFTETPGRNGDLYRHYKCRGRQERLCDLPYLPVPLVERAVIDHYADLGLPASFLDDMTARLRESLADEQQPPRICTSTSRSSSPSWTSKRSGCSTWRSTAACRRTRSAIGCSRSRSNGSGYGRD